MFDVFVADLQLRKNNYITQSKALKSELSNYSKMIFKSHKTIQAVRARIQALEGGIDSLTTFITQITSVGSKTIDKNNYKTYSQQVVAAYDMYTAQTDNGAEIFGAVTDARVACICGEGINFSCQENKAKEKFVQKFFDKNKLTGSNLFSFILTGELEGQNLLKLEPVSISDGEKFLEDSFIKISEFLWVDNQYTVKRVNGEVVSITYKESKNSEKQIPIDLKKSSYIRIGGTKRNNEMPSHRLHRILTQCENLSRAGYDLGKISHLFGKVIPTWKEDFKNGNADTNIKAIQAMMNSANFDIGSGFAGTAEFDLVSPKMSGVEIVLKKMIEDMRFIATNTGIPIHWLSYPELMSNRATAENITRMMLYSTAKERMLWVETFLDLIDKAAIMAVDAGIEDKAILNGQVTVKLPLIDLDKIMEMVKELYVLVQAKLLPASYLLNKLPDIDLKQIEDELAAQKEKEESENQERINRQIEERMRIPGNGQDENNNFEQE